VREYTVGASWKAEQPFGASRQPKQGGGERDMLARGAALATETAGGGYVRAPGSSQCGGRARGCSVPICSFFFPSLSFFFFSFFLFLSCCSPLAVNTTAERDWRISSTARVPAGRCKCESTEGAQFETVQAVRQLGVILRRVSSRRRGAGGGGVLVADTTTMRYHSMQVSDAADGRIGERCGCVAA